MSLVQIALDADTLDLLDSVASSLDISRDEALREAIQDKAYDAWYRAKVAEGIRACDAGDYISHDEMVQRSTALLASLRAKASAQ